jgi:hypothetical protein
MSAVKLEPLSIIRHFGVWKLNLPHTIGIYTYVPCQVLDAAVTAHLVKYSMKTMRYRFPLLLSARTAISVAQRSCAYLRIYGVSDRLLFFLSALCRWRGSQQSICLTMSGHMSAHFAICLVFSWSSLIQSEILPDRRGCTERHSWSCLSEDRAPVCHLLACTRFLGPINRKAMLPPCLHYNFRG